jgi:hypothetical protein
LAELLCRGGDTFIHARLLDPKRFDSLGTDTHTCLRRSRRAKRRLSAGFGQPFPGLLRKQTLRLFRALVPDKSRADPGLRQPRDRPPPSEVREEAPPFADCALKTRASPLSEGPHHAFLLLLHFCSRPAPAPAAAGSRRAAASTLTASGRVAVWAHATKLSGDEQQQQPGRAQAAGVCSFVSPRGAEVPF